MPETPELPSQAHEDPATDELADPYDERDWDIVRDGRMRDFADARVPVTETWEG